MAGNKTSDTSFGCLDHKPTTKTNLVDNYNIAATLQICYILKRT